MTAMILSGDHQITWRQVLRRSLELALIWLILTGGHADAWLPGLVVVVPAAFASLLLPPGQSWNWRLAGLYRFLPFFLRRSLAAGISVARRALAPNPGLRPGLHRYHWRLAAGPARVFFANTVSLLPGTLSIELDDDTLLLHTLNIDRDLDRELQHLETMVADLFQLREPPP
ncbi:MAG: Na+/H+ antiporter subunit E [Desulfurivibrio sp.]|nr:Na+/H+ antiporter subunit E [Desulfurivibrio sp.]